MIILFYSLGFYHLEFVSEMYIISSYNNMKDNQKREDNTIIILQWNDAVKYSSL